MNYTTLCKMSIKETAIILARPVRPHPLYFRSLLIMKDLKPNLPKESSWKNNKISDHHIRFFEIDTFHRAMSPILTIGQIFGIMPVSGQTSISPTGLKFSWKSWRFFHAVFCLSVMVVITLFGLASILEYKLDMNKATELVFNTSTIISLILFLRLSQKWPKLVNSISNREINTQLYASTKKRFKSLKYRFFLTCSIILFLAIIEHLLSVAKGFSAVYGCTRKGSNVKYYFIASFSNVFRFTSYTLWKGIFLQLFNMISAFNWNYTDLFIVVVSMGLTDRFDRLNNYLKSVTGKDLHKKNWEMIREEYAYLSRLVREVDHDINSIIMLSFSNNLFFICVQLFHLFKTKVKNQNENECNFDESLDTWSAFFNTAYFIFSFSLLLARSLLVSLSASRLHSSSTESSPVLFSVPSASYCVEVKRLVEQVTTDIVALSGMNFFYITRGLVLTIAGTIVTYELVLFQFNAPPAPVTSNIIINDTCSGNISSVTTVT